MYYQLLTVTSQYWHLITAQDGREIPTARAITERIVKIRQIAQEKIKNSDGQPQTPSTPKTTPGRKRKANDQPTDKYITNVTSVGSVETPSKKSKAPCKGSPMKKPESRPNTPSSLPHEDKMAGSCMIIKQELKYFGSSSPEEYWFFCKLQHGNFKQWCRMGGVWCLFCQIVPLYLDSPLWCSGVDLLFYILTVLCIIHICYRVIPIFLFQVIVTEIWEK